jgi:hypothetical protein
MENRVFFASSDDTSSTMAKLCSASLGTRHSSFSSPHASTPAQTHGPSKGSEKIGFARLPPWPRRQRRSSSGVAMLDVNLNGQLSYPIADALAARNVPFVFATGYDKVDLPEGYQAYPVLQKPFHGSELTDILANLLPPT